MYVQSSPAHPAAHPNTYLCLNADASYLGHCESIHCITFTVDLDALPTQQILKGGSAGDGLVHML